jgi:hypothetical protein
MLDEAIGSNYGKSLPSSAFETTMKTYSLAIVLVKLLGLSMIAHGIVNFENGIFNIFWSIMARGMPSQAPQHFGQMVATYGMAGLIEAAMGLLLIVTALSIVERNLRIAVEA